MSDDALRLPFLVVYKDGDVWRPLTKEDGANTAGLDIGYLVTQEHMPV
jgi:hypothetical protein